jgi:hypothetical protein
MIISPRQARVKHRDKLRTKGVFLQADRDLRRSGRGGRSRGGVTRTPLKLYLATHIIRIQGKQPDGRTLRGGTSDAS